MNDTEPTLLVVDDDDDFAQMMSLALKSAGYAVIRGRDGDEAIQLVGAVRPALLICDVNMPRLDGFTVCRRLRDTGNTVPIILMTTRDNDVDEALGLDLGADDYLSKPFRQRVLVARIEALLRRERMRAVDAAPAAVIHDLLSVDPLRLEVRYRGERVDLTVTEFRLIEGFVKRPEHVLSRTRLLEIMRDDFDSFVDDRMVDSYVRRLRRKLGEIHASFAAIETVVGAGYRWRADAL